MTSPTSDRRQGLVGNTPIKAPASAVALTNIVLSGEQTVDGYAARSINAVGVPDRILCVGQADPTQNGLWDVSTAAWTRCADADGNYDLATGTQVVVTQGSHASQSWILTTTGLINIGTTPLAWSQNLSTGFLSTLLASAGATLIGWIQTATGAVARWVSTKLGEEMSIEDFGANIANTAAQNDVALAAGLAWAGTGTKTIIAGKLVLGLRALKIPARGSSFKFQTKPTIPNGVRFYGHSQGASILGWNGAGIAIQMGDSLAEYFGISCDNFTINNEGSDTTTSEAIVAINCIRACTISNVMANGFWKSFHPKGEAFGLFLDRLYSQGALLWALHWEGSTACALNICRFDGNGDHGIVIDGQSSAALTPPNNYSPWGVSLNNIVVQGCQKSAVYAIDVQSLYISGASFFESNNLSNGAWADVYVVQGTGAVKSLVIDVQATFGVGSRTGTTNRALTVNSARVVRFNGSSVVGSNFDRGVLLGSDGDRAEVKSYFNIGGNELDAQAGTVVDYQDSSGNIQFGQRMTPTAFFNVAWPVANGNTALISNPSTTTGSVALSLKVGTTGTLGYGWTLTDSTNAITARVLSNGNFQSANNSYSNLSDAKLKQDVVPATSQMDDVLALQVMKYRFKSNPTGPLQIGWIAQQVESISPGLVYETDDTVEEADENGNIVHRPTGERTKAVLGSVIAVKHFKAFQEHVAETRYQHASLLERIAALEEKG